MVTIIHLINILRLPMLNVSCVMGLTLEGEHKMDTMRSIWVKTGHFQKDSGGGSPNPPKRSMSARVSDPGPGLEVAAELPRHGRPRRSPLWLRLVPAKKKTRGRTTARLPDRWRRFLRVTPARNAWLIVCAIILLLVTMALVDPRPQ